MTSPAISRSSINDLWDRAAAELSDDDRRNIDFDRPGKRNVLADLHKLAETSKQKCIDKKWQYTRKSGEKVIFRDLFDKFIKWIDLFKQVGDIVIQYDPVHAALPWAGIRFVLQIAVNDSAKFAFMVEGIALIAELICRSAVIGSLYLRSASAATDELEWALLQLYAAIMRYLSKAKCYFDQNSASQ
ncbi:MAG: hypothetical protein M1816_007283 [Peltula sp. TS41687]|nr:MAG: hypothetical protein M1816_007283 [Peltula sp. TS41687]